jgi:hypothetical protein
LGDCLGPDIYKDKESYDIDRLFSLFNKLKSYDAEKYVESHWKPESKEEFFSYIDKMKLIAYITRRNEGSFKKIEKEVKEKLNREINKDDYELINYFINGLV